jgi:competence ComEA-like helix-hairpin-helix protein
MKKRVFIIFLFIIAISFTSASCENNQIDINQASAEDLDKLSGIGPVKAQAIIEARPFDSIDELIDVVGIGEVTLANIKQQGLACVKDEEESSQEESQKQEAEESKDAEETVTEEEIQNELIENSEKETQKITEEKIELITLNAKSIKSENSKQLDKSKLPIYGSITFCLLLVFLFMLRKDRNNKNEFR